MPLACRGQVGGTGIRLQAVTGSAGSGVPLGGIGSGKHSGHKGQKALFSREGPRPQPAPQASQKGAQGLGCRGLPSGGTSKCGLEQGLPQTDVAPVGGRERSGRQGGLGTAGPYGVTGLLSCFWGLAVRPPCSLGKFVEKDLPAGSSPQKPPNAGPIAPGTPHPFARVPLL